MALTEPTDKARIVEFVAMEAKVKLNRACNVGDVLGVAEDDLDDLGPAYAHADAHASTITYLPRFVAAQAGAAGDTILAYGAAYITGYSSAGSGTGYLEKVYMAGPSSGVKGQVSQSQASGSGSTNTVTGAIGWIVATNRVLLHPAFGLPADTIG